MMDIQFIPKLTNSLVSPNKIFLLGGNTLTIKGINMKNATSVEVGNLPCTSIRAVNNFTLTCIAPKVSEPTTLDIVITRNNQTKTTIKDGLQYAKDAFTKIELFSGKLSEAGISNGVGMHARFFYPAKPHKINNYLYVSDSGNHVIRRIDLGTREVIDFAGKKTKEGFADGIGTEAQFNAPVGMTAVGNDLYVVDSNSCKIRKINTVTSEVVTIAGQNNNCVNNAGLISDNAAGANATFEEMTGITTDGTYLYLGGSNNIRRISLVAPYAVDTFESSNTTGLDIAHIVDLVYLGNAIYYSNRDAAFTLNKLDLNSLVVTLVAGGASGYLDGVGSDVKFNIITSLTTDGTDLYLSDSDSHRLRKVTLQTSAVTTLIGSATIGNADGVGNVASLNFPSGLHYDNGVLYFATLGNHNVRSYDISANEVTTLAGSKE